MAIAIGDTLAAFNSALGYTSPNAGEAEAVAQGQTGDTNSATPSMASHAAHNPQLMIAGAIVAISLALLWIMGGIVWKGL